MLLEQRPGRDFNSVIAALPTHIDLSRQEEGCLKFEVTQSAEDKNIFDVYEKFVDEAAFQCHRKRVRDSAWGRISANAKRDYEVRETMKVHYLEIVSEDADADADAVCKAYEDAHGVRFGDPDELLGGARTCTLADGSIVGVRGPLRSTETPVVRPYWLVEDIDHAVADVEAAGAKIAMPPMEIPGKGRFAIYLLGGNDHGLWQL